MTHVTARDGQPRHGDGIDPRLTDPRETAGRLGWSCAARVLSAVTMLAAVVLVGPAGARADDGSADEQALADKYAPVVRLVEQPADCGPGEPFIPTDIDAVLDNDGVALRGPWETDDLVKIAPTGADLGAGLVGYHLDFPGSPLDPGCTYEEWAHQITGGTEPTVYAHVASERGHAGLALQYWFYYPFNDFNNKHESDWEMMQIEFAASDAATALQQEPTRVGLSQHEGVELAAWDDAKLERIDNRPVVYPAAGSHANYFVPALYLGRSGQQGFGCDDTRGPSHDIDTVVALIPSSHSAAVAAYPWLGYEGRWGQREASFYNGPTGPNTKDQWTAPLTWTDTEGRALSYAVPASGLFGTRATTFFCTTVSTGSEMLRVAIAHPGWAALILTGILLVVALLVRRTTWRPSAPLRVARRRSTGQIMAAVWRMYLGHIWLFWTIGIPIAIATILPGIAELWLRSTADSLGDGNPTTQTVLVVFASLGLALLSPVTLVLAEAAVVRAVGDIDAGQPTSALRAYRSSLRRAVPLLLTLAAVATVALLLTSTAYLMPVAALVVVANLLVLPVIVLEGRSGWSAVRRSARLVRRRWVKVVVLVALMSLFVVAIGPALGTALILVTSLPFAVSNAVAGIVYALLAPIIALNTLYVFADAGVHDQLDPRAATSDELPAEAELLGTTSA